MPTINKLPKKSHTKRVSDDEQRQLRQKAYNMSGWRKLRMKYLKEHPLCEECLKRNKVTPADQVHHKRSPFKKGEINYELFLDPNNLESICAECHGMLHGGGMKPEDILKELEMLLDENIKDEELE